MHEAVLEAEMHEPNQLCTGFSVAVSNSAVTMKIARVTLSIIVAEPKLKQRNHKYTCRAGHIHSAIHSIATIYTQNRFVWKTSTITNHCLIYIHTHTRIRKKVK